jgi:calcineurin-like phosphoesterase family protein
VPNYFFTADTHFGNSRVMEHCARPFRSVREMDETLIENWNNVVGPKDYVYHLGDFGTADLSFNQGIFNQLQGRKYLIKGNHDTSNTRTSGWVWVKDTAMIQIHDQYIWLSHYPHRLWNRATKGVWHLFGHVHRNKAEYGKSFNVGVDVWNYSPISFDHVTDYIEEISCLPLDLPDILGDMTGEGEF